MLLNITLTPYVKSIKFNIESEIQKDVFSAVLFVSETIGKISVSISSMFSLQSDVSKNDNGGKTDKSEAPAFGDILFFGKAQKKNDAGGSFLALKQFTKKSIFKDILIYEPHLRKRADRSIMPDFIKRMLFYISSKSTYDSIAHINSLFANPS